MARKKTQEEEAPQAEAQSEAQYAPPASQVDLAERLANGNASSAVLSTAPSAVQEARPVDEEGYVNVDPIYQNHANDTEAPLQAEGDDNPEAQLEREGFGVLPQHSWDAVESDEEESDEPSEPPALPKS